MTDPDQAAGLLAERIVSAYAQQAQGPTHPQQEQSLLARLVEALRPAVAVGPGEAVAAANGALDAWEQAQPDLRGPRVNGLDLSSGAVTLAAR